MGEMFAPSIDVSDDLRNYARKREEEMRERVEAFRKAEEEKLKNELVERIKVFELTQHMLENPELANKQSVVDQIQPMCKRIEKSLDILERFNDDSLAYSGNDLNDELFRYFCDLLADRRFEIESLILSNHKAVEKGCLQLREQAIEDIQTLIQQAVDDERARVFREINELKGQLTAAVQERRSNRNQLKLEFQERASASFNMAVRDSLGEIGDETTALLIDTMKTFERKRRKLLFTLEKRIVDLSRFFDPQASPEVLETLHTYNEELKSILQKYLRVLGSNSTVPQHHSRGGLIDLMDANHVSVRSRVKFITSFVEKFSSPDLFAQLGEALNGDVSILESLVSLHS
jgi:hypothetical protein